ncbi:MAG: ATP-binding protein [Cyanobacteria bacterium J06621_11]
MSFIYGNTTHAHGYVSDLLSLIALYQEHYPQPATEIQDKIEAIDLDFVQKDLRKIFASMKSGSRRIKEIVLSLRSFARMDESEIKVVDVHQGLDSTVLMLQSRDKTTSEYSDIEIIKDYGQLPLVECYASQLNQVFMHVLSNAIDALKEVSQLERQGQPAKVCIQTRVMRDSWIRIEISDNGIGITAEFVERIFDPFFTTKPVGQGTGLGLSICYKIITSNHKGKIWCDSTQTAGTTFFIEIPINLS